MQPHEKQDQEPDSPKRKKPDPRDTQAKWLLFAIAILLGMITAQIIKRLGGFPSLDFQPHSRRVSIRELHATIFERSPERGTLLDRGDISALLDPLEHCAADTCFRREAITRPTKHLPSGQNASAGDHLAFSAFAFSFTPGSSPSVNSTPNRSRASRMRAAWYTVTGGSPSTLSARRTIVH